MTKKDLQKAWNRTFYGQGAFVDVAEQSAHFQVLCIHLGLNDLPKKKNKKEYIISKQILSALDSISGTMGDEVVVVIKNE